jgi:hypothetical protein
VEKAMPRIRTQHHVVSDLAVRADLSKAEDSETKVLRYYSLNCRARSEVEGSKWHGRENAR